MGQGRVPLAEDLLDNVRESGLDVCLQCQETNKMTEVGPPAVGHPVAQSPSPSLESLVPLEGFRGRGSPYCLPQEDRLRGECAGLEGFSWLQR